MISGGVSSLPPVTLLPFRQSDSLSVEFSLFAMALNRNIEIMNPITIDAIEIIETMCVVEALLVWSKDDTSLLYFDRRATFTTLIPLKVK